MLMHSESLLTKNMPLFWKTLCKLASSCSDFYIFANTILKYGWGKFLETSL